MIVILNLEEVKCCSYVMLAEKSGDGYEKG